MIKWARDLCLGMVVLISLMLAYAQSKDTTTQARVNGERQMCAARYQDAVDLANAHTSAALGEIVVIISTVPSGEARTAQVQEAIIQLTAANVESKIAVGAKSDYNDGGRALPCPIP